MSEPHEPPPPAPQKRPKRHVRAIYSDPGEYAEALPGDAEVQPLVAGSFLASVEYVRIPGLTIRWGRASMPRDIRIRRADDDRLRFLHYAAVKAPALWNGQPFTTEHVMVAPASQPAEVILRHAGVEQWAVLTLEREDFLDNYRRQTHSAFDETDERQRLLRPRKAPRARLSRLLKTVQMYARANAPLFQHPVTAMSLANEVLTAIISAINSAHSRPEPPVSPSQNYVAVNEAIASMLRDPACPLRMSSLCDELAVSVRRLEYAFQDIYGMSPGQYSRRIRASLARKRLQEGSPQTATVTEIAMAYGFWHLGRFSAIYRELFHENPSETLRRP